MHLVARSQRVDCFDETGEKEQGSDKELDDSNENFHTVMGKRFKYLCPAKVVQEDEEIIEL
jgi:hypothetical protein